jgi:hypothetical protein
MQLVNCLHGELDVRSITKKTTGRMMAVAPMRRRPTIIAARRNNFCFDVKALKDNNHHGDENIDLLTCTIV